MCCLSDVHNAVDNVEHLTQRGEKIVLQNHMTILSCKSSLNQLAAADVILRDDTFDCCPKLFHLSFHHSL
jgi:hypothetical protein